jgi:crotonobetainyl-CoA:carnitine CoA-transferase CaiB-like acyl-CoA transferase
VPDADDLPLRGFRILDLTRLLPGAFTTALLADLGAEVLKVEQPGIGDPMRAYPPKIGDASAYTWVVDRNKRSVAVNLRTAEGVAIIRRLAAGHDAVIESFRPGVADRLGVGYEALAEVNPALVYCSLSGYGATGPMASHAGHDLNYIGRAGLVSVTGVDGRPAIPGTQVADLGGALFAASGLLAALLGAQRTGRGRHVDVALADAAFALLAVPAAEHLADGSLSGPGDSLLTGRYPSYAVYECADGRYLSVAALEPPFWRAVCEGVGRPDLEPTATDPSAFPVWRAIFASRTRDEWLAVLEGPDTCVGPVNDMREAMADPQLRARDMIRTVNGPDGEEAVQIGPAVKFSGVEPPAPSPAPALGDVTRAVLADAGYSDDEIERLVAEGVVEAATAGAAL